MAKKRGYLIAEKPSLRREIEAVYKKHKDELDYELVFDNQAGHILGLKLPKEVDAEKYGGKWKLSNYPEVYPYEYKISPDKKKMYAQIKEQVKKGGFDFIVNAGDPDQEGQLLIDETLIHIGNKLPVKRFWTNDLTEGAIVGALKNLRDNEECIYLYEAALARQHADYQFGMNCTGALSCKVGDLCKIGRVKAPIISILAKRELEIRNYVEKKTYKPAFRYKDCEFVKDEVFDTPEQAMKVVPNTEYADIKSATYKVNKSKAPKLFKLSTLQTEAHSKLGWSGQKTLDVLQTLYEMKATSYPRTGCEYISSQVNVGSIAKSILKEVSVDTKLLVREPGDVLKDKTYANDKAVQAESHTAVIPTGNGLASSATEDQRKLYELICRRFLAMFGPEKETMSVKVVGVPSGTKDEYVFTESYDVKAGYELILSRDYKMKAGCGIQYKDGMNINPIEFFPKELVSQKPSRYNDGSLIKALETPEKYEGEDGKIAYKIGTPATRANIIEECQKNGYFTKDRKGAFTATDKAIALYETFGNVVPMFMPTESGKWEEMLDKLRNGETTLSDVESTFVTKMEESVDLIKNGSAVTYDKADTPGGKGGDVGNCPSCKSPVKDGQYGPYCSGKCGVTFGKVFGKELTKAQWGKVLNGERILLKNLKSQSGKTYSAYVKPVGVEDYSYTGKDGKTRSGKSIKFDFDGYANDKER
jgi:DNA topoisomerase-3